MAVPMGRRRLHDHDLPPHMHRKVRGGVARYYYGRSDLALGSDFGQALRKYADLHAVPAVAGTFAEAATQYAREELPKKAPKTQREYTRQLAALVAVFGAQRLDEIRPKDVADFLRERGKKYTDKEGKVRGGKIVATREKALLSAVISFARGAGLLDAPNPCAGILGTKSKRTRDAVTDAELVEAIGRADPTVAAFLELCYVTGQRPGDVAKLRRRNVHDGTLTVVQAKTGAKVRIAVAGPLAPLLARLMTPEEGHAGKVSSLFLIRDDNGQPLTLGGLRARFAKLGCDWWFMDLRAKAATDTADATSNRDAQKLLGHAAATTTDSYIRQRAGERATPIMRNVGTSKPKPG